MPQCIGTAAWHGSAATTVTNCPLVDKLDMSRHAAQAFGPQAAASSVNMSSRYGEGMHAPCHAWGRQPRVVERVEDPAAARR